MRSSNVFGKTGSAALYEKALGSEYDVVRRVHNSIDNVDIVAQYISGLLQTGDIIVTGENLTGPLRYAADNFVILEGRVNEVDADISAIQATVVAEETARINSDTLLAQNITNLVGQINTANGTINAVSLRVSAAESAATALTSRVNVTESSITTLSNRTTQAEANITAAASAASAASVSAATANALAGTKNKTFLQPESPIASAVGDLWFDSNNSFITYRWNGAVWETVRDSGIQVALDNLGSGGGTGGGVSTFYQTNAPTATAIGDIWVDSDDSNKLYRWNGLAWEQIRDSGITLAQTQAAQALSDAASAITSAANAQATADGKVTTYFQNDIPTAEAIGDLWSDTNDGNRLYRWSGTQWVEIRDQGIAQAITAAATAEAIADSKIVSFYQNEPPTAGAVGDLWIDTNDSNRLYRWNGSTWVAARDAGIAAAQAAAAQALLDAANAISAAATAQGTADGKVVTFFQPGSPGAQAVGDLWIDTDDGNKLYRWSGSAWNAVQDAAIGQAITAASTAQSTADGKIVTFYQTSAPTAAAIGDLWIDTDDNNRLYRWSGSAWVNARDASIAIAQAQANDANAAAFAANTAISIITADGFLSRDEKPEIRKQRDAIIDERPTIRARAVALNVAVTNYDADYTALIAYLAGLDLSGATDTAITRSTFNTFFTDYYAERQTVLDRIALEASKRASGVPLGNSNRVPFSRFEGGRGWDAGGAPLGGQPFRTTFEDQEYIVAQPVFSAAGQAHVLFTNPGFPVVPNERLSVSAFAQAFGISSGPNPTTWVFYIEYRDATNGNLGFTTIGSGSGFLLQQLSEFSTVPATARRAVIVLLAISSGAGTVQMALREPMVTSAAADQTVHPPYTPGPNAVDGALPNNLITIDGGGVLSGIGTAGINVDNRGVVLSGLLSARPGSGAYIGQTYTATDTREFFRWDGSIWQPAADITAVQQRSIIAQFPSIEVKQGEAGSAGNGNRTVTHKAFRAAGTVELTGGTWSIVSEDLGAGDAAVNSSTGTVTLSGIMQSGKYALLYVHTDGLSNLDEFNVTYVPTPPGGVVSAKVARTATNNGTDNNNIWQNILTLSVPGCPAGRVNFGGIQQFSFLAPQSTSAGDADFEARLQMDGVTLTSVLSQNVVTGGIMNPTDFTELFNGSYPVSAGTHSFTIDMRRTSGTARIFSTSTVLEATVIAS